jgi:hypothetical protein
MIQPTLAHECPKCADRQHETGRPEDIVKERKFSWTDDSDPEQVQQADEVEREYERDSSRRHWQAMAPAPFNDRYPGYGRYRPNSRAAIVDLVSEHLAKTDDAARSQDIETHPLEQRGNSYRGHFGQWTKHELQKFCPE